jgi:hypothetical protein
MYRTSRRSSVSRIIMVAKEERNGRARAWAVLRIPGVMKSDADRKIPSKIGVRAATKR